VNDGDLDPVALALSQEHAPGGANHIHGRNLASWRLHYLVGMADDAIVTEGPVTARDIEEAAAVVGPLVRSTPLLPAGELSRRFGGPVTLKAECLQHTGSFKVRGASNRVSRLSEAELAAGVVAASAGNHAQAVAVAARRRGASADLFMPVSAPLSKVDAVRGYGGDVHLIEGAYEESEAAAREFAGRRGATLVPPFDDPLVVAGQGTIGLDLAEQAPATRLIVVPMGGGALAAGIAIAVAGRLDGVRVVGVVASTPNTICDGIAVKRPGELTRPLLDRHVDEVVTVSDDEVAQAMVLLLERSKMVTEGAGAASVAAILHGKVSPPDDGETCALLSGGNVDASRLAECIRLGETAAGRRMVVVTVVPDRPGALASLLRVIAEQGANVLDVVHLREGIDLHVRETAVRLVLQTDGPEHGQRILNAVKDAGFRVAAEHSALPGSG
jgi:threonine dehydratase